jgi:DinB family protein
VNHDKIDPMDDLCASLFSKIHEQLERARHLAALLPADKLDWTPPEPGSWSAGILLGHLLDCAAGFCAVLSASGISQPPQLRELPVNHCCTSSEAIGRLEEYGIHIRSGFEVLTDADLARRVPTVFVPEGETVLTLLLGNLEHLINHKHQLFGYLKRMGVAVETADLYRLRTSANTNPSRSTTSPD